jgi:hypothetical protein
VTRLGWAGVVKELGTTLDGIEEERNPFRGDHRAIGGEPSLFEL